MTTLTTRIVVTAMLIAATAAAAAAAEKIESNPAGNRITVDGDPSDWDGLPVVYLRESLRVLSIAHDQEAIYLMFRFGDRNLASFIRTRGVMLWFNGDGKQHNKKEVFGVRYPGSKEIALEIDAERAKAAESAPDAPENDALRALRLTLEGTRQLPGELTIVRMGETAMFDESDAGGVAAASAINDGVYCYEFRVPFSEVGGKVAAASAAKERKLAVGIVLGGLTKAEEKELKDELDDRMDENQRRTAQRAASGSSSYGPNTRSGSMAGMSGMWNRDGTAVRRPADSGIQWHTVSISPVG
jgi:hypothetical protein